MPIFKILRRVDAFADFTADVEAADARAAVALASGKEELFEWAKQDVHYFDAREFVVLDEDGCEVESTRHGDF